MWAAHRRSSWHTKSLNPPLSHAHGVAGGVGEVGADSDLFPIGL